MASSTVHWLQSKPFAHQILILALVLDTLGALMGYLLAPTLGVDPIMGAVFGLVAASIPMSLWITRYSQKHA